MYTVHCTGWLFLLVLPQKVIKMAKYLQSHIAHPCLLSSSSNRHNPRKLDSFTISLFVDRLSLSNQKQKATGDEAAERVKAVAWRWLFQAVATGMTQLWIEPYSMSANCVPAILYPGHDRESGGQVTDHSSVLDHHSVTDQQSQALDQRGSVIKTHRLVSGQSR